MPLRVQEMRRRLGRIVLAVPRTAPHRLAWSDWRRGHQASATHYHDKCREAEVEAWVA